MNEIRQISAAEAQKIYESGGAVFVDVRDPASYEAAHIPGALHLSDANLEHFIEGRDKTKPVVAYCYHGNTSQGAAAYLMDQGFQEVYSVIGGFEAWRGTGPIES